jgi:hypothetical protein
MPDPYTSEAMTKAVAYEEFTPCLSNWLQNAFDTMCVEVERQANGTLADDGQTEPSSHQLTDASDGT